MAIKHWSLGNKNELDTFSHCQLIEPGTKSFPVIKKLEVWHSRDNANAMYLLIGIRITYTDGTRSPFQGNHDGHEPSTFTFDDGELVREMWLGVKTEDNMFGSLSIETNRGRYWRSGPKSEPWSYRLNVHSGFWLGISGGITMPGHSYLGQLGFYFLEELSSVDVEMEFLTTPDPSTISRIEYNSVHGDNRLGRKPLHITIDRSEGVTRSTTTEEGWAESLGVSASVSAGFFGIGEASASTEYNFQKTHSESVSHEETVTLGWSGSVEVNPGDYTIVDMFYYTGRYEVSYKATITLRGRSGSRYVLDRFGSMNGTSSGIATFTQRHLDNKNRAQVPPFEGPQEQDLDDAEMPPNSKESTVGKH